MRKRVMLALTGLAVAAFAAPGTVLAAKGGKPGGGGGGDDGGGSGTAPAPVITYQQSSRRGVWDVMVMDADGGNQTVLVADVNSSLAMPSWSPDGSEVIFAAGSSFGQGWGIYRVPVDGSADPTFVVATGTTVIGPTWSPTAAADGNEWIAYMDVRSSGGTGMDVFVVSPGGGTVHNVTEPLDGSFQYPCWSPDATQMVSAWRHTAADGSVRNDLILFDVVSNGAGGLVMDTTSVVNLTDVADSPLRSVADTSVAGDQDYKASWGRTGDTLVVEVFDIVNGKDNHDLWEIPVAAPQNAVERTSLHDRADGAHTDAEHDPSYSPDDAKAVFWLRGSGNGDSGIYTVELDGNGTLTPLVSEYSVRAPTWFRGIGD